jgi:hypothetical protein
LAALLHEAGASVHVVARVPKLRYHDHLDGHKPSLLERLQNPITGIGPGWKLWMCTNMPLVFRLMPVSFRVEKVRQILGPAPCWFIKEKVEGKVALHLGVTITGVSEKSGRVAIDVVDKAGTKSTVTADHLIAATGFKSDLQRLSFLEPDLAAEVQSIEQTPSLSANFESTARNLFFVGVTAANTFGPLLRFAYGAGFAAPRISKHLKQTARQPSNESRVGAETEHFPEEQPAEPVAR